ncbi:Protein of unknown function [Sphingomonas sp. YR710]|uniref:DUF2569 family protein n=1 Tax=Sphingomonas sp. YR710 TaxID=1882773 RepID=UPI00088373BE|nr:DUF2569 family protein [Sphingomonas sp. YR710]SDD48811.1 Protein of unknown function [Sphingomonas sp. YR710]
MFHSLIAAWERRGSRYALRLEVGVPLLSLIWLAVAIWLCAARNWATLAQSSLVSLAWIILAISAPVIVLRWMLNHFNSDVPVSQPRFRLARAGRWRSVDYFSCRQSAEFGPGGFMAMLLIGLLLNVAIRTIEFFAAMPLPTASAPKWLYALFMLMSLDLMILSSCYAVAFALALRRFPLFPRVLAGAWMLDMLAQIVMSRTMHLVAGVPASVQMQFDALLHGNLQKVAISVAIWLPYLLLSRRVNLTYRQRIRA